MTHGMLRRVKERAHVNRAVVRCNTVCPSAGVAAGTSSGAERAMRYRTQRSENPLRIASRRPPE